MEAHRNYTEPLHTDGYYGTVSSSDHDHKVTNILSGITMYMMMMETMMMIIIIIIIPLFNYSNTMVSADPGSRAVLGVGLIVRISGSSPCEVMDVSLLCLHVL